MTDTTSVDEPADGDDQPLEDQDQNQDQDRDRDPGDGGSGSGVGGPSPKRVLSRPRVDVGGLGGPRVAQVFNDAVRSELGDGAGETGPGGSVSRTVTRRTPSTPKPSPSGGGRRVVGPGPHGPGPVVGPGQGPAVVESPGSGPGPNPVEGEGRVAGLEGAAGQGSGRPLAGVPGGAGGAGGAGSPGSGGPGSGGPGAGPVPDAAGFAGGEVVDRQQGPRRVVQTGSVPQSSDQPQGPGSGAGLGPVVGGGVAGGFGGAGSGGVVLPGSRGPVNRGNRALNVPGADLVDSTDPVVAAGPTGPAAAGGDVVAGPGGGGRRRVDRRPSPYSMPDPTSSPSVVPEQGAGPDRGGSGGSGGAVASPGPGAGAGAGPGGVVSSRSLRKSVNLSSLSPDGDVGTDGDGAVVAGSSSGAGVGGLVAGSAEVEGPGGSGGSGLAAGVGSGVGSGVGRAALAAAKATGVGRVVATGVGVAARGVGVARRAAASGEGQMVGRGSKKRKARAALGSSLAVLVLLAALLGGSGSTGGGAIGTLLGVDSRQVLNDTVREEHIETLRMSEFYSWVTDAPNIPWELVGGVEGVLAGFGIQNENYPNDPDRSSTINGEVDPGLPPGAGVHPTVWPPITTEGLPYYYRDGGLGPFLLNPKQLAINEENAKDVHNNCSGVRRAWVATPSEEEFPDPEDTLVSWDDGSGNKVTQESPWPWLHDEPAATAPADVDGGGVTSTSGGEGGAGCFSLNGETTTTAAAGDTGVGGVRYRRGGSGPGGVTQVTLPGLGGDKPVVTLPPVVTTILDDLEDVVDDLLDDLDGTTGGGGGGGQPRQPDDPKRTLAPRDPGNYPLVNPQNLSSASLYLMHQIKVRAWQTFGCFGEPGLKTEVPANDVPEQELACWDHDPALTTKALGWVAPSTDPAADPTGDPAGDGGSPPSSEVATTSTIPGAGEDLDPIEDPEDLIEQRIGGLAGSYWREILEDMLYKQWACDDYRWREVWRQEMVPPEADERPTMVARLLCPDEVYTPDPDLHVPPIDVLRRPAADGPPPVPPMPNPTVGLQEPPARMDPNHPPGWARLIRSYVEVVGQTSEGLPIWGSFADWRIEYPTPQMLDPLPELPDLSTMMIGLAMQIAEFENYPECGVSWTGGWGPDGYDRDWDGGAVPVDWTLGSDPRSRRVNLMRAFIEVYGLTPAQAAGPVGNFMVESGGHHLPPDINQGSSQPGPPKMGELGYGWAQWSGGRHRQFVNWSVAHGYMESPNVRATDAANWAFIQWELANGYKSSVAGLRSSVSPGDAAVSWEATYEKAGKPVLEKRIAAAEQAFAEFTGGPAPDGSGDGDTGSGGGSVLDAVCGAGGGGIGGVTNGPVAADCDAVDGPVPPEHTVKVIDPGDGEGIVIHKCFAEATEAMLAAASGSGIDLDGWGYRSTERQVELRAKNGCGGARVYDRNCRGNPPTAVPGRSRHEFGLAIDFASLSTAGFNWLSANAASYHYKNLPVERWHWSYDGH